jgi:hypothetical protein
VQRKSDGISSTTQGVYLSYVWYAVAMYGTVDSRTTPYQKPQVVTPSPIVGKHMPLGKKSEATK